MLQIIKNWGHLIEALLAQACYGFPAKKLKLIGVTGTKGKSTVVFMLNKIFESAGIKVGMISTINNDTHMTMPSARYLQQSLRRMVREGKTHAIIEISSQGILQWRHLGLPLEVLAITNLQKEHIEAHGSFEEYRATKARAIKLIKPNGILVLNTECPHASYYYEKAKGKPIEVRYFSASDCEMSLKLPGEFNRANAAAAMVVARAMGVNSFESLSDISVIPGRMERIPNDLGVTIFVDYAHTVDSLREALTAAKKFVKPGKKLIAVFGSMGEGRDSWARPEKGKVAAQIADQIVLTEEESGLTEPAEHIMNDIASGISRAGVVVEKIVDRRGAIEYAIQSAEAGDVVIIAGMGNLNKMIKAGDMIAWDDREEVRKILSTKS